MKEMSKIELASSQKGAGKVKIEMWENFEPTALKNIPDPRLKDFLARQER